MEVFFPNIPDFTEIFGEKQDKHTKEYLNIMKGVASPIVLPTIVTRNPYFSNTLTKNITFMKDLKNLEDWITNIKRIEW